MEQVEEQQEEEKGEEEEEEMNAVQLNKDIVKDIRRKTTVHRETRGHTHHASSPYMRREEVEASPLIY